MTILQSGVIPSTGGYQIERSLRFNSADSAYLNRTPASAGSRTTWTWSSWVKRAALGTSQYILQARVSDNANDTDKVTFRFTVNNTLILQSQVTTFRETTAVYRDTSAWYHVVLTADTSNATANNRFRIYVNGVEQVFSTTNNPTSGLTTAVNSANAHWIGSEQGVASYLSAYITETYLIDGQALTPSSFGETDSATGVWKPKAYSGTYGTNGFYLKFADNSGTTSTTLGKDSSGNGNNWTPNNFSVTAGVGNDSLVDSPTSYGTDTGVGGEVRGNYCTLNPLQNGGITITNGNLTWAGASSSAKCATGSIAMTSGKWYFEALITGSSGGNWYSGVCNLSPTLTSAPSSTATGWGLVTGGGGTVLYKSNNNVLTSLSSSSVTGAVVSFAVDVDAGKIWFAQNGTWLEGSPSAGTGASYTNLTGTQIPYVAGYDSNDQGSINFGQRAFAYTAPSGFKALCTQNLPTPTIGATSTTQANRYFDIVLYQAATTNGTYTHGNLAFRPDFTWIKNRDNVERHFLIDVLRGNTNITDKFLVSNSTAAEGANGVGGTTFSVTDTGYQFVETTINTDELYFNNRTYAGWNWKANGAGSSNTAGSITSTVSANTTSGFSIVTASASGTSPVTVGHGLGVTPSLIIGKVRDVASTNWYVYSSTISAQDYLVLNSTAAKATSSNIWDIAPTSTVFTVGNPQNGWAGGNSGTKTYVFYCFAPVAGYSAFGSFVGNANADGPMVYLGFRPRWILIKNASALGDWFLYDTARNTYNVSDNRLKANLSDAEGTGGSYGPDILSNGFKMRSNFGELNGSGNTIIYAAFAETPAKFSLAR